MPQRDADAAALVQAYADPDVRRWHVVRLDPAEAWAFGLGFHRLELQHPAQNPSSCRVAEKAGFGAEGTKRSAGLHLDGWHDMHLHARFA